MNAYEFARATLDAKTEMDATIAAFEDAINEDAKADDDKRRAMARAFVECRERVGGKPTVAHLEALVDLETSEQQMAARMAEGRKRAAAMHVEGARQWMSILQSLASLTKAEAQIAAYEPREVA